MIEVYTDGASKGNPGLSGAGIVIKAHGETYEHSFLLGKMSNHEAEFHAVLRAMTICSNYFYGEIISLRSDSKIVADIVEKNFTKNRAFLPFLNQFREAADHFPHVFMKWIPEKQNTHADYLARKALREY
ncbi:reverse transcriptase-like protein [Lentibacillus halophilus]|uniref:Reverse transcriptase-like protein n=1 Tax=Lentibacillus halophilus TaxID=295065 RepID=A0ABP3JDW4_9BACI